MRPKNNKIKSPSSPLKRSVMMFTWLSVLAVGLWALMHYSAPESNLEPYKNILESKVIPEKKAAKPAESAEPEFTLPSDLDTGTLIKTATSLPTPQQSQLPRETLEHIQKGMLLTEEGKFNAGDMEFEEAAKISPNSPELFSIWGAALRMAKKFEGAKRRFARAHELSPNDEEITFNWGMTELEADHAEEAIRLFQKTIKLSPNNYMAYNMLGKSFGRKKMYEKEQSAYKKAVSINPDFAQGHFNLGIVLGMQKKFKTAGPHFLKAIELDKQFEKPFVIQMLTALGLYDPAAEKPIKQDTPKTPEPVQQAKVETANTKVEKVSADKKSEGSDSDHKMEEGSKKVKNTTTIKGNIQINGKKAGPNTLVFLETKSKLRVANQKPQKLTIRQNGLQFSPQHSVVLVGSTVTFSNEDREVHNIFSKSLSNQFNLGAMASGAFKTVDFTQAGPVVLRCNMHKDMIGTLFVVPNGHYTKPNANGDYQFDNINSEGYIMQVWDPILAPDEVEANLKSADLTGVDQTFDFNIKSASVAGEIHDMTDPTDYNAIVDNIEKEMLQAIEDWKNGKKFISRKRMLMAITKHYAGEGLKGAIAKSFSSKRSIQLEQKLDEIRKEISGYGKSEDPVTESSLISQAKFAVSQLRLNIKELEARLQPTPVGQE